MGFTPLFNGATVAIRYTPGQLCDVMGLSKDTWRYWRQEIAWLSKPRGRPRACYGPGELLAVAVLKQLHGLGVPISRLIEIAESLHEHCRSSGWPQLERTSAIVELGVGKVGYLTNIQPLPEGPLLVLPLGPIIASLREHLFEEELSPQRALPFPPLALRGASA